MRFDIYITKITIYKFSFYMHFHILAVYFSQFYNSILSLSSLFNKKNYIKCLIRLDFNI